MSSVIATLWSPSLNPLGSALLLAVVAVLLCWTFSEWSSSRRFQKVIVIASAGLFLGFLFLSAAPVIALLPFDVWNLKHRRFPGFGDYLGNYIVMSVGLLLALKLRTTSRGVAVILAAVFALIIIVEVGGIAYWRFAG